MLSFAKLQRVNQLLFKGLVFFELLLFFILLLFILLFFILHRLYL